MSLAPKSSPRLLLVDDDDALRRAAKRLLEARLGANVTGVSSAAAALELIQSGVEFDAAIVDLEMPGMDGLSLIDELGKTAPAMPCGVWSASQRVLTIDAPLASFILEKQFWAQLVDAVRWMLANSGPSAAKARPVSGVQRRSDPVDAPPGADARKSG